MASFKPVFKVQGKWYDNGERYETHEGAKASAEARFMKWTMPSECGVEESPDEPNRYWSNGSHMLTEVEKATGEKDF